MYEERAKRKLKSTILGTSTHVLFIIHLPRQASSFVGFQGDPWISTHIDDLRVPTEESVTLAQAVQSSISDLFYSEMRHEMVQDELEIVVDEPCVSVGCYWRLHNCIQAAATKLFVSEKKTARLGDRIGILVKLIPKVAATSIGKLNSLQS